MAPWFLTVKQSGTAENYSGQHKHWGVTAGSALQGRALTTAEGAGQLSSLLCPETSIQSPERSTLHHASHIAGLCSIPLVCRELLCSKGSLSAPLLPLCRAICKYFDIWAEEVLTCPSGLETGLINSQLSAGKAARGLLPH